jgi:energy-coupling factor transporter ATP-binding protein EcfA2
VFNPFPGLRPFEPDEDHLFFGREREIDELLRRLRSTRFLSVVGTSGSGKSSLVRSGLIPSLYSGFMVSAGSSWRVAMFRPGEDPIGHLAEALDQSGVLGADDEAGSGNRALVEATLRRGSLGIVDAVRYARIPSHDNLLVVVDQFEELFRFRRSRLIDNSRDDNTSCEGAGKDSAKHGYHFRPRQPPEAISQQQATQHDYSGYKNLSVPEWQRSH